MKTHTGLIPLLGLMTLAFAGATSAQEQVVKIGHSGPLSGPNAFAGKDNENGIRLAIDELNGRKIVVAGKTLPDVEVVVRDAGAVHDGQLVVGGRT